MKQIKFLIKLNEMKRCAIQESKIFMEFQYKTVKQAKQPNETVNFQEIMDNMKQNFPLLSYKGQKEKQTLSLRKKCCWHIFRKY